MSLTPGTRLGVFELTALIGRGGMGEVYRATDTKLKRQVAIKILPPSFAADHDRLARFQREAEVLASLNHPNIAAIYGLEESEGIAALVMELVEGDDLSQRIARGAIPIDEALPIAKQIAEALEVAHEQGIIHRDLKPANIKVRSDGTVKVLDFGLAKALEPASALRGSAGQALSQSPTITSPAHLREGYGGQAMTQAGMILGTAAYMSPEQAKGRSADRRSDLWAFGCVLYEMLTGHRLFAGDDMAETLADVIKGSVTLNDLPEGTPVAVRRLLRRCLQKDRAQRLDSAAIARLEIGEASTSGDALPVPTVTAPSWWARKAVVAAAMLGIAATAVTLTLVVNSGLRRPPEPAVTRFEISPPEGEIFPGANLIPRFAVSPDGTSVAFQSGIAGVGPFQLWIRRLDQVDAQPIPVTAGTNDGVVQGVFWLADGSTLGYFDGVAQQLKTVDVRGERSRAIADMPGNQGAGTANSEGTILYASSASDGIMRVAATGGTPQRVTSLAEGEVAHLWPSFLPDGRHFLYLAQTTEREHWTVYVGSLDDEQRRPLVETPSMAQFAAPDRLLFVRNDSLFAQRMDLGRLELVGDPVLVAQPMPVTGEGRAGFSVSASGVLVYASGAGAAGESDPAWVDRAGRLELLGGPRRRYSQVRLSPDGTRVAVTIADGGRELWMWSQAQRTLTRLTFTPTDDHSPAWTPDSRGIVFRSGLSTSVGGLFRVNVDGTGAPERLLSGDNPFPTAVTPDGGEVLYDSGGVVGDVHRLALDGNGQSRPMIAGTAGQSNASVSSDGRWVAYQSNESGRPEVSVRPFPDVDAGRWQVSTSGGAQPVWARDGRELFYIALDNTLMLVTVGSGPTWSGSVPTPLFNSPDVYIGLSTRLTERATYDVSLDGKRFLMLKSANPAQRAVSARLTVVTNWQSELARPPEK